MNLVLFVVPFAVLAIAILLLKDQLDKLDSRLEALKHETETEEVSEGI